MDLSSVSRYLLFWLLLTIFIMVELPLLNYVKEQAAINYQTYNLLLTQFFFNFTIGVLFGLCDHLLPEIKLEGRWRLNVERFIFIGIPTVFLAAMMLIYFYPACMNKWIFSWGIDFIIPKKNSFNYIEIAQAFGGYILISCFYKSSKYGLETKI